MSPNTSGQRWSRDLLDQLSASGYRPHAWVSFFRRSLERAAHTRRVRPELTRQLDVWLGMWLAAAAGARTPAAARLLPHVPPSRELRWWAGTALLLRWHLGMVEGPLGEPRDRLAPADALALGRVWAAPRLSLAREPRAFVALLALIGAADAIDGPLARRSGTSRLGRDLDRLADLCAFGAAVGAARRAGWIAPWARRVFVLRYAAGAGYVTGHYLLRATPPRPAAEDVTRALTPALVGGLAAGAAGARTAGSIAVAGTSLVALAAQAQAARAGAQGSAGEVAGSAVREAASRSASSADRAGMRSTQRPPASRSSTT